MTPSQGFLQLGLPLGGAEKAMGAKEKIEARLQYGDSRVRKNLGSLSAPHSTKETSSLRLKRRRLLDKAHISP